MLNKYIRQTILKEIGEQGQLYFKKSKILCVGAGGLGSPVCLYLAAAGIGKLGIIDGDNIEISNLHRQILFNTKELGKSKVSIAYKKLSELNPDCIIQPYENMLTSENALEIISQYHLIIDGSDNNETKYLINDCAVKLGIPVIFAALQGLEGRITTFWAKYGPCYRCLYKDKPSSYIPNCAEFGILGPIAGIFGSLQALEALKIIIQMNKKNYYMTNLIGKLFIIDCASYMQKTFTIKKNIDCSVCSISAEKINIKQYNSAICNITGINKKEALHLLDATYIDVREKHEYDKQHIKGAINIPLSKISDITSTTFSLNFNKPYILYCSKGLRSKEAYPLLKKWGFKKLYHLTDSYL